MNRRTWLSFSIPIILLALLFVLGSCVLPGTGTINVRNRLSGDRVITDVYVYPQGAPDTHSEISSSLHYNDVHSILGIAPGPVTVEAVIDSGAAVAKENLTVVDGTIHVVWIVDGDIVP